jgi:hypothetical protein
MRITTLSFQIADRPGQRGGKQQHDDQEILELVEELQPQRTRPGFDQPVLH